MRNSSKKMAVIICVVALVLFFLLRYLLQEKIQVRTAEVVLGDITQGISYSGSIESARRVRISSEIAGRVAEVLFEELDEVVEGQALIKLDDAELKGQLTQAQEALNQAEINLANARKNLHRVKKLFEKGFASREQLDGAEQAVDVGEALVKQHRSNYEVLRTRLNYTTIKAPLSGTVISKNVTAGEIVAGPLAGGGIAMPTVIAEIADLSDLEVHVNVDEIDVAKVVVGQGATIAIDALPDTTFRGVVKEIASMTSSRREMGISYRVRVGIQNPESILKLGMTANVDFITRSKPKVLTVPKGSIIAQRDKKVVFTVNEGKVRRKEVTLGIEGEEFVEVTSGVSPGERVIVEIITEGGENGGGKQIDQFASSEDSNLKDGQSLTVIH